VNCERCHQPLTRAEADFYAAASAFDAAADALRASRAGQVDNDEPDAVITMARYCRACEEACGDEALPKAVSNDIIWSPVISSASGLVAIVSAIGVAAFLATRVPPILAVVVGEMVAVLVGFLGGIAITGAARQEVRDALSEQVRAGRWVYSAARDFAILGCAVLLALALPWWGAALAAYGVFRLGLEVWDIGLHIGTTRRVVAKLTGTGGSDGEG
jgi:hypothetical protein